MRYGISAGSSDDVAKEAVTQVMLPGNAQPRHFVAKGFLAKTLCNKMPRLVSRTPARNGHDSGCSCAYRLVRSATVHKLCVAQRSFSTAELDCSKRSLLELSGFWFGAFWLSCFLAWGFLALWPGVSGLASGPGAPRSKTRNDRSR